MSTELQQAEDALAADRQRERDQWRTQWIAKCQVRLVAFGMSDELALQSARKIFHENRTKIMPGEAAAELYGQITRCS